MKTTKMHVGDNEYMYTSCSVDLKRDGVIPAHTLVEVSRNKDDRAIFTVRVLRGYERRFYVDAPSKQFTKLLPALVPVGLVCSSDVELYRHLEMQVLRHRLTEVNVDPDCASILLAMRDLDTIDDDTITTVLAKLQEYEEIPTATQIRELIVNTIREEREPQWKRDMQPLSSELSKHNDMLHNEYGLDAQQVFELDRRLHMPHGRIEGIKYLRSVATRAPGAVATGDILGAVVTLRGAKDVCQYRMELLGLDAPSAMRM
jgi:hypothetical protein